MERTRRVKIITGLKCNIQCLFCYYRNSLNAANRTYNEVRKDLLYARRHGIHEVDLSGGEPTVHPELLKIICEAKTLGMRKVSIITNGLRMADREYVRTLKEAGLDDVLFSVHGASEQVHDGLTSVPGSFGKLSQALGNAFAEGLSVRTNTVVNRSNCGDLQNIASFIQQFKPDQVNFIVLNDWCFAKHLVDRLMMPYSEMGPLIQRACDVLDGKVPAVNVRYIPFCMMQGYERFVANHAQVPYDRYEWVPHVRARLETGTSLWRYLGILGYGFFPGGAWRRTFRMPYYELLDSCVTEALRSWYYTKGGQCKGCSRDRICDGVENTYARKYGLDELTPIAGKSVTQPTHLRNLS